MARRWLIGGLALAAAAAGALAAPAEASTRTAGPTSYGPVSLASLQATGLRTDVVVRGLRSRAQAAWIDQVVQDRLVSVEGCLPDPGGRTLRHGTYRTHVQVLCPGGNRPAARAAAALAASRPWYRVTTSAVPVVAFAFLADLGTGNGEAVPAALAQLPSGEFTIAEGDDVSLTYVGQGVTQSQLDAARAAFAAALHLATSRVSVTPIG